MDKELTRFLEGEINVYRGELTIGRERAEGRPSAYFVIKAGDAVLKEWWGGIGNVSQGKTMGGKKPYIMLMTDTLHELMQDGKINLTELGCLVALTSNIEWGTGKIIHRRTKAALTAKEISALLGVSQSTFNRVVKGLKASKLISVTKDGYFVSYKLFKKGSKK